VAESIEWFVADQAFLWSYDSAPRPPPSLSLSRQQVFHLSQSSCVLPVELIGERGGGRGAKSFDHMKALPSRQLIIQHSARLCNVQYASFRPKLYSTLTHRSTQYLKYFIDVYIYFYTSLLNYIETISHNYLLYFKKHWYCLNLFIQHAK
jgi:hypothetical protein